MFYETQKVIKRCRRTLELLEAVTDDEELFQIYWCACVTQLRIIEDVLYKKDAKGNKKLKKLCSLRRKELNALKQVYNDSTPYDKCSQDFLFYHRFIHNERNIVVHEFEMNYSTYAPITDGDFILDDINVYRPMGQIDRWGDLDCRDWIKMTIEWWECELINLEKKYKGSKITDTRE